MRISFFFLLILLPQAINSQTIEASIFFELDKAEISTQSAHEFDSIVLSRLDSVEVNQITISGHTDGLADNFYNKKLAEKRIQAVKSLFEKLNMNAGIFKTNNFGEDNPNYSNATNEGRKKNRRVDVVVFYKSKPKIVEKKLGQFDMAFENDTIINGPKGTQLLVKAKTFYPNKIKDVDFQLNEVFSKKDMILNKMPTMTYEGECLETGGMIFSSAFVGKKEVEPQEEIIVRIPANEIDTSMQLYNIEVVDGDTLWKPSTEPLVFNSAGNFYEFRSIGMPNINIDKATSVAALPFVAVVSLYQKIKMFLFPTERTITVKSRWKKYEEAFFVSQTREIVIDGTEIKPKKTYFIPCSYTQEDVVVSYAQRNGRQYFCAVSLAELKYKRKRNRFVIKRKHYQQLSDQQIEQTLEKMFPD